MTNGLEHTYTDGDGNLYYVRHDEGRNAYKGVQLLRVLRKGQHREIGIRGLVYRETYEEAQRELSEWASQHNGIQEIRESA